MIVFAFSGKAQQVHFVYLQTENGQPFYVKINNKLISSSSEGYIILPDLKDGDYQLVVGFPKKEFPEENFMLPVDKKNEGFLLKNFEEKGWQLFNLQTLALIQGTNEKTIAAVEKKEADPFSTMLASVVKDSSILQDHEVVPPPVKTVDTLVAQVEKINAMPDTLSSAAPKENSLISMILNKEDKDGLQRIYEDKNDGSDTIRIFFPFDTTTQLTHLNQDSGKNNIEKSVMPSQTPAVDSNSEFTITPTIVPGADSTIPASGNENSNALIPASPNDTLMAGKVILSPQDELAKNNEDLTEQQNKNQIQQPDRPQPDNSTESPEAHIILLPKEVTSSKVNSDCKAFATNEDFLKLRKKMASEYNAENMVKIAKKYLKLKCYSTEQIKDLSYLFLKDEGKYMFFDAAYPFTSNSDQYQILQSQLTDEYYLNRFKAMIRK
jgi:hypothetical protein